ncbi:MAG TPA: bifunctional diaminohydroxyphosphoribosylaminopyrimidine deaminase/5-amino-6-(5-phosphoribosylamino)uracil reductase RibD [Candidatus Eremiobacteraceae bacterium]|nr:bifunctional diaminohydroxyphosphoribosylaminopyrimidine deaminase/5-amino-6-(5-phosphoribosylamino)uracil reductase RibD [Candidatus Eremiobacteraceae bacterium]
MSSTTSSHDWRFMQHALDLARKGVGLASPNPTVGCVVVKDGAIVGDGFHQYANRDHAEIVALKQAGDKARGATLYVTLEPCNHTGRTGPCTEAIIAAGVSRVVAAMEDPNPKTRGNGFGTLHNTGVEVESGVLEQEAAKLNEAFAHWITTHKPFVTLKSALTLDGQLVLPQSGRSKKHRWITSEEARAEVHRMRHASDALLTGIGTILKDDPLLTDRSGLPRGRPLVRVVLDTKLQLSAAARVVRTAHHDLVVFTAANGKSRGARKLQDAGVELIQVKTRDGRIDLNFAMKELGKREILSVLLEAGPRLNGTALNAGIVQKLVLFYAPKLAGSCGAPFIAGSIPAFPHLLVRSVQQFGPDVAIEVSVGRSKQD